MKKKLSLVIYFSFLIIYLELVYKLFVLNNVFSINSLTIILFSIPFIMINTILCSLFSEKVNRGISILFIVLKREPGKCLESFLMQLLKW